jgi:hypothetical protein
MCRGVVKRGPLSVWPRTSVPQSVSLRTCFCTAQIRNRNDRRGLGSSFASNRQRLNTIVNGLNMLSPSLLKVIVTLVATRPSLTTWPTRHTVNLAPQRPHGPLHPQQ